MNTLIEINNLKKVFPVKRSRAKITAVNDISFNIIEGKTFGLIGESGSGKTTVGRCLLKLVEITNGSLKYKDIEYTNMKEKEFSEIRSQMQMVFQEPYYSLNPRSTVWQTVYDAINVNYKLKHVEKRDMVVKAFNEACIDKTFYEKYPHQLSMGQQQRVGIARAIVSKPNFIVLDEPTSSLDVIIRSEIIELLINLQNDLGITYLFISHDLSTIEFICHQVAVMYLGTIVEIGNKNHIFYNPRHPYSIALLASVMKPDPKVQKSNYKLEGEIPSVFNIPQGCPLSSRCPVVEDICKIKRPPMIEIESGHFVNCFFAKSKKNKNKNV